MNARITLQDVRLILGQADRRGAAGMKIDIRDNKRSFYPIQCVAVEDDATPVFQTYSMFAFSQSDVYDMSHVVSQ